MAIAFPGDPGFNCAANVDAASSVAYGSQLAQFVTLVLNTRQEQG